VSTHDEQDKFSIVIEDNGMGMSPEILNKIFNPFFTTKVVGKGTGLGLTMTYDIITKVHQGKLRVESEEGKYARFFIEIPKNLKNNY
jgi:two-component system NtrC family sensor kinase